MMFTYVSKSLYEYYRALSQSLQGSFRMHTYNRVRVADDVLDVPQAALEHSVGVHEEGQELQQREGEGGGEGRGGERETERQRQRRRQRETHTETERDREAREEGQELQQACVNGSLLRIILEL